MPPHPPALVADLAALAGAIERWAADLALGEEPARFVAALEAASPPGGRRSREGAPTARDE
jgi:hypothetical protein